MKKNKMMKMTAGVMLLSLVGTGVANLSQVEAAGRYVLPSIIKPKPAIDVLYNGKKINMPNGKPMAKGGSVFVPIRAISETLGSTVSVSNKDVSIRKAGKQIRLKIGTSDVSVDGQKITGISPSFISEGSTMVPVRVISESFGEEVQWDEAAQSVWIGKKEIQRVSELPAQYTEYDFKDYYLGERDYWFINPETQQPKKTRILTVNDFPFDINGVTYYRIERTKDSDGGNILALYSTYNGQEMPMTIFLLEKNTKVRTRSEQRTKRESLGDGLFINYFSEIEKGIDEDDGFKDGATYSLTSAEYFRIKGSDGDIVLLRNPWKK